MQKFLRKIKRSIKKSLSTFNKNWIKRRRNFKRSILTCKGSQAGYLSHFSLVKENVCFPGYPELGPDALTDLTKLLLVLPTLRIFGLLFVNCFLKYKVPVVMAGLRIKQTSGNMLGMMKVFWTFF